MLKKSHVGWVVAVMLLAAGVACSSSSGSPSSGGTGTSAPATKTVGAAGGTVATPDGALTVTIPAGALAGDTVITIQPIASPLAGAIGQAYEIGPSGTQFATPVTLAFKYAGADLQGNDPTSLEAATIVGSEWLALAGDTVDTAAQVATGTTTHLSPYGLHARGNGGIDSGSSADATTSDDSSTPTDSGGATDATDAGAPGDAAFDAAGCSQLIFQVGTCANHPVQMTCPAGTFIGSCVNNMVGYTLECCANDGG